MAIALINSTKVGAAATAVSPAIDTTGATLIVAMTTGFNSSSANQTLTDSQSNTWTKRTFQKQGSQADGMIIDCVNPTTNAAHTFTLTLASGSSAGLVIGVFGGTRTASAFDQENGATGTSNTTQQPGSVTPSEDNELIVTGIGWYLAMTQAVNLSFALVDYINYNTTGGNIGAAMWYLVQGSAAAVNPTWTAGGTMTSDAAVIATYKAAASAGQPTMRRWGGVPSMGTGGSGRQGGGGARGPWGHSRSGALLIPRWLADHERQAA